jgi:hypothetical protein
MNWMIDGAHGDLYRRAWQPADPLQHEEWSIERNRKPAAAAGAAAPAGGKTGKRPLPVAAVLSLLAKLQLKERFVS